MDIPVNLAMRFKLAIRPFLRQVWEAGLATLLDQDRADGWSQWRVDVSETCYFAVEISETGHRILLARHFGSGWWQVHYSMTRTGTGPILTPLYMSPGISFAHAERIIEEIVPWWPLTPDLRRRVVKAVA